MFTVNADFSIVLGPVKPMHAVNNGPVYMEGADRSLMNIDAFIEAGIPYARTHDSAYCPFYGGEHTVDVHAIFPDFTKDENDPASYDFVLTDEYIASLYAAGVKPFYRLGSKIEHWKRKYGTLVPTDFGKWARVCEHIIRHFIEGWADGFRYDIAYWEIWNEPDLSKDDDPPVMKQCWSGTREQYFELYEIASKHLKTCFPHLKIGGPAAASAVGEWMEAFLAYCRAHSCPLDFYSWHRYAADPHEIAELALRVRKLLNEAGFTAAESICNEWNYVKGWWSGPTWVYTLRSEKGLKGASFIAGTQLLAQAQPIDLLMYYDARPNPMNGMFDTDEPYVKLKGYYPFWMFNKLKKLGSAVECVSSDSALMTCAATGTDGSAVMLTYYRDEDEAPGEEVKVSLRGLPGTPVKLSFFLLDAAHDAELVREETVAGTTAAVYLKLDLFSTVLVTVSPVEK